MAEKERGIKEWAKEAKEWAEPVEKGAELIDDASDLGTEYKRLNMRLESLGVSAADMKLLDTRTHPDPKIDRIVASFSANEIADVARVLKGTLSDTAESFKALQVVLDFGAPNKIKYGLSAEDNQKQVEAVLHSTKVLGHDHNALELKADFDESAALRERTDGEIDAVRRDTFISALGDTATQMSRDGRAKLFPLMERLTPDAAAAAVNGLSQHLLMGKATDAEGAAAHAYGLVDEKRNETELRRIYHGNWTKHRDSVVAGSLVQADLLRADPMKWLEEVLLPALKKRGRTSETQVKEAMAEFLPDPAAAAELAKLVMHWDEVDESVKRLLATPDARAQAVVAVHSDIAPFITQHAQAETLMATAGSAALPTQGAIAENKTGGAHGVDNAMRNNPGAASAIMGGLAGLGEVGKLVGAAATGALIAQPLASITGGLGKGALRVAGSLFKKEAAGATAKAAETEVAALLRAPVAAAARGAAVAGETALAGAEGVAARGALALAGGTVATSAAALATAGYVGWKVGGLINSG
ncbi:MAG: hypothetical protein JO002_08500, partial [Burkholderiaceae bacterium]|nr:hypothetical protein [Burkholderiaceae bacterium]